MIMILTTMQKALNLLIHLQTKTIESFCDNSEGNMVNTILSQTTILHKFISWNQGRPLPQSPLRRVLKADFITVLILLRNTFLERCKFCHHECGTKKKKNLRPLQESYPGPSNVNYSSTFPNKQVAPAKTVSSVTVWLLKPSLYHHHIYSLCFIFQLTLQDRRRLHESKTW